ncbi:ABC transporter permease [Neomoorella mulderi]|uniref:Inner membrane transport permease YbhR n=1 Tax=Moorella mulderi DSM 14980 TaxID=1122241 RepID=A0A151B0Z7_9FIRM|nr:ABC transporter permease [Moorella mulderi]KYH33574.1 inner membrane transport permease YbhR [Moorella mulderi DSM 14980]
MRQILNIAHYEMLHIFKEKILFLMVFLVPLGYAALFGAAYVSAVLNNVPVAIVDLDDSKLSREIAAAFANSPHFKVIDGIKTYAELQEGMKNGRVRAGVIIPEHFEQDISRHALTRVLTIYDGSNLIWGYNTRKYIREVFNDFIAGRAASYLAGLGYTKNEVRAIMDTVSLNTEVWYNPTFSYTNFLYMGLIMIILHQIGLLSVSLTVTREKERRTWLQFLSAPVPAWKIFAGKALPYFVAGFFNYALLLWFAARFIQVKIGGSLPLILLLGLLYDVIITAAGFFISTRAPNSLQVTRYVMLLSVPLFMISGFTWPWTHIPAYINFLARLLPSTWMMLGFRQVALKELEMSYVLPHIWALILMAFLAVLAAVTFPKRLNPPPDAGPAINSGPSYPSRWK